MSDGVLRVSLTGAQREQVFQKTAGYCHVCGGKLDDDWQADHIVPVMREGRSVVDNFLPAHARCNRARWMHRADRIQAILEMGVWLRAEVEKGSQIGRDVEDFVKAKFKHARKGATDQDVNQFIHVLKRKRGE